MIAVIEVMSCSQIKTLITRIVFSTLRGVKRARIVTRFKTIAMMFMLRPSKTTVVAPRSRLSKDHPTRLTKRVLENPLGNKWKDNKPSTKWLVLKSLLPAI